MHERWLISRKVPLEGGSAKTTYRAPLAMAELRTSPVVLQQPADAQLLDSSELDNPCISGARTYSQIFHRLRYVGPPATLISFYRDLALHDGWSEVPTPSAESRPPDQGPTWFEKRTSTSSRSLTVSANVEKRGETTVNLTSHAQGERRC